MIGGSKVGRTNKRTRTGVAGIRFEWAQRKSIAPALCVVVTYTDKERRARHTYFSTNRHGLEGALDKAIQIRVDNGCPTPDRDDLLAKLRAEYMTKPLGRTPVVGWRMQRGLL